MQDDSLKEILEWLRSLDQRLVSILNPARVVKITEEDGCKIVLKRGNFALTFIYDGKRAVICFKLR